MAWLIVKIRRGEAEIASVAVRCCATGGCHLNEIERAARKIGFTCVPPYWYDEQDGEIYANDEEGHRLVWPFRVEAFVSYTKGVFARPTFNPIARSRTSRTTWLARIVECTRCGGEGASVECRACRGTGRELQRKPAKHLVARARDLNEETIQREDRT